MSIISRTIIVEVSMLSLYLCVAIAVLTMSHEILNMLDFLADGMLQKSDIPFLLLSFSMQSMLLAMSPATFFAVYLVLSRKFVHSEVFVWLASGYSVWRIAFAVFSAACIIATWTASLYFWLAPSATRVTESIIAKRIRSISVEEIANQNIYQTNNTRIYTEKANSDILQNVMIHQTTKEGIRLITAKTMEIVINTTDNLPYFYLKNGVFYSMPPESIMPSEQATFEQMYMRYIQNAATPKIDDVDTMSISEILSKDAVKYIQALHMRIAEVVSVIICALFASACSYTRPRQKQFKALLPGTLVVACYIGGTKLLLEDVITTHLQAMFAHLTHCVMLVVILLMTYSNSRSVSILTFWQAWIMPPARRPIQQSKV